MLDKKSYASFMAHQLEGVHQVKLYLLHEPHWVKNGPCIPVEVIIKSIGTVSALFDVHYHKFHEQIRQYIVLRKSPEEVLTEFERKLQAQVWQTLKNDLEADAWVMEQAKIFTGAVHRLDSLEDLLNVKRLLTGDASGPNTSNDTREPPDL